MRAMSLVCLLAVFAQAAPVPETPYPGPTPFFFHFAEVKGEAIVLSQTRFVTQEDFPIVHVLPALDQNGAPLLWVEKRFKTTPERTFVELSLALVTFETGEGKPLATRTALSRLKPGVILLVAEGSLDPAYGRLLADDALVLIRKRTTIETPR